LNNITQQLATLYQLQLQHMAAQGISLTILNMWRMHCNKQCSIFSMSRCLTQMYFWTARYDIWRCQNNNHIQNKNEETDFQSNFKSYELNLNIL